MRRCPRPVRVWVGFAVAVVVAVFVVVVVVVVFAVVASVCVVFVVCVVCVVFVVVISFGCSLLYVWWCNRVVSCVGFFSSCCGADILSPRLRPLSPTDHQSSLAASFRSSTADRRHPSTARTTTTTTDNNNNNNSVTAPPPLRRSFVGSIYNFIRGGDEEESGGTKERVQNESSGTGNAVGSATGSATGSVVGSVVGSVGGAAAGKEEGRRSATATNGEEVVVDVRATEDKEGGVELREVRDLEGQSAEPEQASEHSVVVEIGVTAQEDKKEQQEQQEEERNQEQPELPKQPEQHEVKDNNEIATVSTGVEGNRKTSSGEPEEGEAAAVIPRTLSQDELSRYHTKDRGASTAVGIDTPSEPSTAPTAASVAVAGTNAVSNQTYASNMLRLSLCKAMLSSDSVRSDGGGVRAILYVCPLTGAMHRFVLHGGIRGVVVYLVVVVYFVYLVVVVVYVGLWCLCR